jgi:riboflavin transporter FmnP
MFKKITIALFAAAITSFALARAFAMEGLHFRGLMGVDILTINIAHNPNLDMILGISILAGIIVYMLAYLSNFLRKSLNWAMIVASFGFFFTYIFMFFRSVITYYASTITALTNSNILISAMLLLFMTLTILFYILGVGALLFELWLRNELGLRKIIPVKELPESIKHFDMSYIHHESRHDEKKHGKKFDMLKEYILKEMRRGHGFSVILKHILHVGWSLETVEDALRQLEKNAEFKMFSANMEHKHRLQTDQLAEYIEREMIRKIPFHKTLKMIKKFGWTDADLIDALVLIK